MTLCLGSEKGRRVGPPLHKTFAELRAQVSSFARPDSRGRLSPHELLRNRGLVLPRTYVRG